MQFDSEMDPKLKTMMNCLHEQYRFTYVSKNGRAFDLKFTFHAIRQFIARTFIMSGKQLNTDSALSEMETLWTRSTKDISNKTKERSKKNKNNNFIYHVSGSWRFVIETNTMTIITMELIGQFSKMNNDLKHQKIKKEID